MYIPRCLFHLDKCSKAQHYLNREVVTHIRRTTVLIWSKALRRLYQLINPFGKYTRMISVHFHLISERSNFKQIRINQTQLTELAYLISLPVSKRGNFKATLEIREVCAFEVFFFFAFFLFNCRLCMFVYFFIYQFFGCCWPPIGKGCQGPH